MFSVGYKRFVLGVLTLLLALNYLDRSLMFLLLEPIKSDLRLSDTQLGLLSGFVFFLFYATLGIPIARWADRGNRSTIASLAIAIWGVTVMLCLFVTNFLQLALARIAAAVGEAGCMPPTYSLVGDYFPRPAERTRAMAIYMLGGPLAVLLSFGLGGWLNERYGWRFTLFLMGVPGLIVAALVKLTVIEPRSRGNAFQISEGRLPTMIGALSILWQQRSSRHLIACIVLFYTLWGGLIPWYAAFMIRNHGVGTAEVGIWFGMIFGAGGIVGMLLGGYLAGRAYADDEPALVRLSAVTVASLLPFFVLSLLLPQKRLALIAMVPLGVVGNFLMGPIFALLQRLVVEEMRATTLAIVMMLANLVGMGLAPAAVGMVSDLGAPIVGPDSLRYGMIAMSLAALWSAYHLWQVGHTVKSDLLAVSSSFSYMTSAVGRA